MPSYPAKPYEVPHDDWFNNNSSNFEKESKANEIKSKTSIHEFFYRQSHETVGESDNLVHTTLARKSSEKINISFQQNSNKSVSFRNKEKYSFSKIPLKLKSIKRRSFKAKNFYKILSYKNIFNLKSYLLDLKSAFKKIIKRNNKHN